MKHVCGTVPKSGVMGGGDSRGEVRQNLEKFPGGSGNLSIFTIKLVFFIFDLP
jgi:hypothetical protein